MNRRGSAAESANHGKHSCTEADLDHHVAPETPDSRMDSDIPDAICSQLRRETQSVYGRDRNEDREQDHLHG
jgi:hypothetical protein